MKRRNFLKMLGISTITTTIPRLTFGQSNDLDQYFIYINANGGWDVTYFCDPKVNEVGKPVITNWSKEASPGKTGEISYAPVANNKYFFEKHRDKTLVINGVNMNTVNHTSGAIYSTSGKIARTHPTLSALNSSNASSELAIPFMTSLAYKNTKGLVSGFNLSGSSDDQISRAAYPYHQGGNLTRQVYMDSEEALLESAHSSAIDRLLERSSLLEGDSERVRQYNKTKQQSQSLHNLAEYHKTLIENAPDGINETFVFMMAGLCSGYTSSADIGSGGFDSHADNDARQIDSLEALTRQIDYVWDVAEAGGIADRLTVLVGSDFSRTPSYNKGAGKDHWPVGSFLVMNQNAGFGNKVIGSTTSGHYAHKIDMSTLEVDESNGEYLTPEHVHYLVREHLGLNQTEQGIKYALGVVNPINI
ncbi:DUF1501 domain-containing protein [Vibrio nomapromontoriensis]|uniref:DUF1501 domain-containing protein n=1 Tax=Vibrio nomapromontoriensis TaxID=2910246 RepID=UPI003D0B76C6